MDNMLNKENMQELIKNEDFEYKNMLFASGYLFSDLNLKIEDYPFFGNWGKQKFFYL